MEYHRGTVTIIARIATQSVRTDVQSVSTRTVSSSIKVRTIMVFFPKYYTVFCVFRGQKSLQKSAREEKGRKMIGFFPVGFFVILP